MKLAFVRKCFLFIIIPTITVVANLGCPNTGQLNIVISSPSDGDTFIVGNTIRFTSQAVETGGFFGFDVPVPATYEWTSSLQGLIGTTSDFQTTALMEGVHVITMTVIVTDDPCDCSIAPGTIGGRAITITVLGETPTEGMGEGTGEGSGEGTGEGAGEGSGEGAGEGSGEGAGETCVVQRFETPTDLGFFDGLEIVDVEIDMNRQVHLVFIVNNFDSATNIATSDVVYHDPEGNSILVASASINDATQQGESLSNAQVAITRSGAVYVQYLKRSSLVGDDWIAHRKAVGSKVFAAGFQSVQRVFPFLEADGYWVDLKAMGDDRVGNAVIKTRETVLKGGMIDTRSDLEVHVLGESGIDRIFLVDSRTQIAAVDFSTCEGTQFFTALAVTGPNKNFTIVTRVGTCGSGIIGQLYRLNRPEDNILTGPDPVELDVTTGFLGPSTFDEQGVRHQMRARQTFTKEAKGTSSIVSTILYRRGEGEELFVDEDTQTATFSTCTGSTLDTHPGTQITVGPTGDIVVVYGAEDCNQNIMVWAALSETLCSAQ